MPLRSGGQFIPHAGCVSVNRTSYELTQYRTPLILLCSVAYTSRRTEQHTLARWCLGWCLRCLRILPRALPVFLCRASPLWFGIYPPPLSPAYVLASPSGSRQPSRQTRGTADIVTMDRSSRCQLEDLSKVSRSQRF